MKTVVFIHGWGGYPGEGFRPWIVNELRKKDVRIINPEMPNTNNPKMLEWVSALKSFVPEINEETYFVGHSLGAVAILRFFERIESRVGGAIFVAGFTDDLGIPELENFFESEINWEKIKNISERFVSIQSDNDPYELARYNDDFKKYLNAKTMLLHNFKHFSGDDGISEIPELKNEIMKMLEI